MVQWKLKPGVVVDRFYRGAVVLVGQALMNVDERSAQLLDALAGGCGTADVDVDVANALAQSGVIELIP